MGLRGFEEQGGRYEGGRGKVSTRFLAFVSYVQRVYCLKFSGSGPRQLGLFPNETGHRFWSANCIQ